MRPMDCVIDGLAEPNLPRRMDARRRTSLAMWAVGTAFLCAVAFSGPAQARVTERLSVSSAGAQGNGISVSPSLSADGRYVAFSS